MSYRIGGIAIQRQPNGVFGLATIDRDMWLALVLEGEFKPKPPEWWLRSEEREKARDRTTASIIWSSRYSAARKFVVWSQAPDEDFRFLGYLE